MATQPTSLLDLSKSDLSDYLSALGQPSYRARQLLGAVYRRLIFDPAAMSDLPRGLREALAERLPILPVTPIREQVAEDGQTRKWLFQLPDGKTVETVLMEYNRPDSRPRRTVCLSTQVGCAIGCLFCATGRAGLTRNLSAGEIVGQVLWVARFLADRDPAEAVTNVVFMGQGEPVQNLPSTLAAIDRLNDPELFGLGARHLTVSTSGLVPGIRALAADPHQVNLAVSLHAPNDELRSRLVPINVRYPIAEVLAACREYLAQTGRRITFEYVLIDGLNDDPALGRDLGRLLRGMLCHVNLIPINPIGDDDLRRPSRERVVAFAQAVAEAGIPTTIRIEKGVEIAAACGQLRTETGRRANWAKRSHDVIR